PHAPSPQLWGCPWRPSGCRSWGLLCSFQRCFVCGESGATITCSQTGCKRRFHLPCAVEGSCVTHWFGDYR
ncbi:hypothetical protein FK515_28440, partial [Klebsiella pneumoniae]|nr:hypothetical protein [Klebsiella pneumoniae]